MSTNQYADIESSYHEADSHIKQEHKESAVDSRHDGGTFKDAKLEPFISIASNNQSMEYYDYMNNN